MEEDLGKEGRRKTRQTDRSQLRAMNLFRTFCCRRVRKMRVKQGRERAGTGKKEGKRGRRDSTRTLHEPTRLCCTYVKCLNGDVPWKRVSKGQKCLQNRPSWPACLSREKINEVNNYVCVCASPPPPSDIAIHTKKDTQKRRARGKKKKEKRAGEAKESRQGPNCCL